MSTTAYSESTYPELEPSVSRSDDKTDFVDETIDVPANIHTRPPIDYSSVGTFSRSVWGRFVSLWTKRFILSLIAGQVVSLCITCTNVTTTELVNRNWSLPTTQTFFLWVASLLSPQWTLCTHGLRRYFSLFVIYTPYTIYQCKSILSRGALCAALTDICRWVQGMGQDDHA